MESQSVTNFADTFIVLLSNLGLPGIGLFFVMVEPYSCLFAL